LFYCKLPVIIDGVALPIEVMVLLAILELTKVFLLFLLLLTLYLFNYGDSFWVLIVVLELPGNGLILFGLDGLTVVLYLQG